MPIRTGYDFVLCIDLTCDPKLFLDPIKKHAVRFFEELRKYSADRHHNIDELRVRVIVFRDYYYYEDAMRCSEFFRLPEQNREFCDWINALHNICIRDDPEDGLEALALAIKSNWNYDTVIRRHVVVMMTSNGTHDLGYSKASPSYPDGMPRDLDELSTWWKNSRDGGLMDLDNQCLFLFAPDDPSWNKISDNWRRTTHIVATFDPSNCIGYNMMLHEAYLIYDT